MSNKTKSGLHTHDSTTVVPSVPGVELRPIPGFMGYAAGSDGHVYSFRRRSYGRTGTPKYQTTPRPLVDRRGKDGRHYVHVLPPGVKNRGKNMSTHRAVALAFHGPCPRGKECSHLNGDCLDNRPNNLAWETPKENHARKHEHGTMFLPRGEHSGKAKLTNEAVREIRRGYKRRKRGNGKVFQELADKYGVSPRTVTNVAMGYGWEGVE